MNKKEFNYYMKNKDEITAPILGLMLLYEEAESKATLKYLLPDELISEAIKKIGNQGDWLEYRNTLGIINSLRYNFVEAETYKRTAYNVILSIKSLYTKLFIKILATIQKPNEIVKELLDVCEILQKDEKLATQIKDYKADLENNIIRVTAYNKFVTLLSKTTNTANVKNFQVKTDILIEKLNELTAIDVSMRKISKYLPKDLKEEIEALPKLNFNLAKCEPNRKNVAIVNEMIQEIGAFLNNDERVNNSFIRYLIYGGV